MLRHYFQYQTLVFYIGIVQNYLNCSIPRNQEIKSSTIQIWTYETHREVNEPNLNSEHVMSNSTTNQNDLDLKIVRAPDQLCVLNKMEI